MLTSLEARPDRPEAPVAASVPAARSELTITAWSPREDLSVGDWVRNGRWLGALGRASGWWIGDWIRYGNARYGERYEPAARVTGYDVQSLRNMAYVAGRFDPRRRRDSLSFSHHAELAALPAEEQDLWLDRAVAGAFSVGKLRSELRHARRRAASRAALAEARRKPEAPAPTAPPEARVLQRIQPPALPDTSAGPGSGTFGTARTGTELVCPHCGRHFVAASGSAPEGRVDPRPSPLRASGRLALAPLPDR
jgi:hypothetical protein